MKSEKNAVYELIEPCFYRGREIELIRNPKEVFSDSEKNDLTDILLGIARDGFGTLIPRSEVIDNAFGADALYLVTDNHAIKGFCSYKFLEHHDQKLLHLKGVVLSSDFQDKGLFYEINRRALEDLSPDGFDFLVERTQSPVVYAATTRIVKEIYPNPDSVVKGSPDIVQDIAVFVAASCNAELDAEHSVIRNLYSRCLYDKVPRHLRANDFFDNILKVNYDSGDSVVVVGKLR